MSYKFLPLLILSFFFIKSELNSLKINSNKKNISSTLVKSKLIAAVKVPTKEEVLMASYQSIDANNFSLPSFESYEKAVDGFEKLKSQGKINNEVLTIVDFSLSSTKERMWIIDMKKNKILLRSLCAHGINSGYEYASDFSNKSESHKSSLGFYITGETYYGTHGYSLKIDGQEKDFNNNARKRSVVVHGADYVDKNLARKQGYIGRSQGCPAVPLSLHKKVINNIKNKSVLFLFHPSKSYANKSKLVS